MTTTTTTTMVVPASSSTTTPPSRLRRSFSLVRLVVSAKVVVVLISLSTWMVSVCHGFTIPTPTTKMTTTTTTTSKTSSFVVQQQSLDDNRRRIGNIILSNHNHMNNDRTTPTTTTSTTQLYMAGGFEWEDPTESFDQGVENPYKNPDLMKVASAADDDASADSDDVPMKIDPARLLGPRLNGSNLYLIGMMGSGKSSVGDKVARRMGTYNFLDTDQIIEQVTGLTIPEIFDEEGEDGFRSVESQVLDSVHSYVRCVVSTGGGLVCKVENWGKLQSGIVVWLDVNPTTIMKRIEGDTNRPLLQTENPLQTLQDLLEERKSKYSQADLRIEITEDMTEDDVAETVVRELHDFIDENPPQWKLAKQKAQSEGLDWVK